MNSQNLLSESLLKLTILNLITPMFVKNDIFSIFWQIDENKIFKFVKLILFIFSKIKCTLF